MWYRVQHLEFTLETTLLATIPGLGMDKKHCSDRASKSSIDFALALNQFAVCLESLMWDIQKIDLSTTRRNIKILICITIIEINDIASEIV